MRADQPGSGHSPTLQEAFDPRRNSFDVLRLVFAVTVGVTHGFAIQTGWQPFWGSTTIGDVALDGFFILSGFLVARSYLTLSALPRFLWHRFLRIMPAFWVCLLVTALLVAPAAAVLQSRPAGVVFGGDRSAWHYLLGNAGLFIRDHEIAGIFLGQPEQALNGSLWTLAFEAFCYGVVAVLGVAGLLHRRRGVVLALAGILLSLTVVRELGVPILTGYYRENLLRLLLVFLLGSLAYLYADRIPMRGVLAAVSAAVVVLSGFLLTDYRALGAVALTYLYLWIATCLPWAWSMRTDLSYGMYIYHYPVFQLMALTILAGLPTPLFVVLGLLITLGPAAASWFVVEKPALARKHSPFPDRVATAIGVPAGGRARTGGRHRLV